jgi:DNA-binding NarL/FixJ family response regulator
MEQMENLTLAIVDMEMPDMSGLELTQRIRKKYPNACIIVATMYDERSLIESAYRRGCDIFLVKPHGFMDLFKKLTSAGTKGMRQEAPLIIDQYGLRPFRSSAVSAS